MRSARRAAVLVVALGAVVTVVGLVSTVRSTLEWQDSARISGGPRVLATVVSTGAVVDNQQEVTLRYEDGEGETHVLDASFPLGLADKVRPGETTSVTYDPSSPDKAQLEGQPRQGLHDVALAGGVTMLATAVWLGWSSVLFGGARTARRQAADAAAGTGIALPPCGFDGEPSSTFDAHLPEPSTSVTAASRSHQIGTAAVVASLLVLLGSLTLSVGAPGLQESAFPPLPPEAAPRKEPVQLPAVLSDPPPSSGPLVTPEKAYGIFEAAWRMRDEALVRHDVDTIRALEAGPALEADLARMEAGGSPNRTNPGPDDLRWSMTYVPRQTTWPVYFLGEAVTTSAGEPWLELMVLERTGPDAAWQIVFNTGMSEGNGYTPHLQLPILDDEGYNVVPPATWIAPQDVVPALARFWQSWLEKGEPPAVGPSFAPGSWTTDYVRKHAGQQGTRDANGLPSHYIYGKVPPREGELWTFGVDVDRLMVCAPMRDEVTWTGPAHQDAQQRKWGRDLAPGVYASVTSDSVRQPCVLVPSQPAPMGVFGADRWGTALRGVLANGVN